MSEYKDKYLTTGQVEKEVKEIIAAVSAYLSDEEKIELVDSLDERILSLESMKQLVLNQGRRDYGRIAKGEVATLFGLIPEKYKLNLQDLIFIGREFQPGRDFDRNFVPRKIFFSPSQGELFLAQAELELDSKGESNYKPNVGTLEPVDDLGWFDYALLVADKLVGILPNKYSKNRYLWRLGPVPER